MNTEDFVPYNTAVILKQLNFNKSCDFVHIWFKALDESVICYHENAKNSKLKHLTVAPTYSQVFKWFRDKHKLSGIPTHQSYEIWNLNINECFIEKYPIVSYKKAEYECLKKLIFILKHREKINKKYFKK